MMTLPERRRAVVRVFRAVPEETILEYGRMGERIAETEGLGDHNRADRCTHDRDAVVSFFPIVEQAFGKDANKRVFHFQMMTDSETVVKIGQQSLFIGTTN